MHSNGHGFIEGGDLLKLIVPSRNFFLPPLIFGGSLSMIYAHPGIGKTWFTLWLSAALAAKGDFLRWRCSKAAKVFYIDSEMGQAQLKPRFEQIVNFAEFDIPEGQIFFCTPDHFHSYQVPNLATEEGQDWYSEYTKDAEIIIIDNLGSASAPVSPRETEEQTWLRILPWFLKQRSEGRAVILVHHAGKSGAQLGTSRREQPLDLILKLSRPTDYDATEGCKFNITFDKARHMSGPDLEGLLVKLIYTDSEMRWDWKLATNVVLDRIESMLRAGVKDYQILRDINRDMLWTQAQISKIKRKIGKTKAMYDPDKENDEADSF